MTRLVSVGLCIGDNDGDMLALFLDSFSANSETRISDCMLENPLSGIGEPTATPLSSGCKALIKWFADVLVSLR